MSRDLKGFVLSIAGVPYLFSTGGLPALTSTSPLWFGGEDGVQVLDGWLEWPRGWSERAKPLDGDLDTGAQTFRLHDASAAAGVATGHPVLTWLATRNAKNVTSTPLAANISASGTSMTVSSGAALGSVPRWVWCEREALHVSARATNVLTVARGALGTKAAAHALDDGAGRLPEVFADVPWITRRKAVLWGVDAAGVATALWSGFAVRSPRLSDDGARFDLPCDSLWQVLSQAPVGNPDGVLSVYGFGASYAAGAAMPTPVEAQLAVTYAGLAVTAFAVGQGVYPDLAAIASDLRDKIYAQTLATLGTRISHAAMRFDGAGASVSLDHATLFQASLELFGQRIAVGAVARTAGRYTATLELQGIPRSRYLINPLSSTQVLVRSLANAGGPWTPTVTTLYGITTTVTPCLRGAVSKDLWLVLTGVNTSNLAGLGPLVTGTAQFMPRKAAVTVPNIAALVDCTGLNVCQRVTTDHWLDGLHNGAAPLLADAGTDDFDWSTAADVRALTMGRSVARDWMFDGRVTFGKVTVEACQLSGCTPVMRSGRLGFHAWTWPDARPSSTVSLTATDVIGPPTWLTWEEGLANRIKVESEDLVIDATDSGSINRYGPGRQLSLTLLGRDNNLRLVDDPIEFSREVLGRMELWADPIGVVRVTVPLRRLADLEVGAQFTLTDWLTPDGAGGRGLVGAVGLVVAREVVIEERGQGVVKVDGLLFPRISHGYAPCGRVAALTAADTVSIAATPVQAATGYSGGDDAITFEPGDAVELVVRDSTTLTTETKTVLAVLSGSVQFTSNVGGTLAAAIGGGSVVELRFAHWATPVQASQEGWMFVGDLASGVIDGTAESDRPIAP